MVEGDGSADRLRALMAGGEPVLHQVSFQMGCFGMLERGKIGFEELFGSRRKKFDRRSCVEGNVLHRFTLPACGLEDAMLQIDRSLARYITRMNRHKGLGAAVFHPVNRAVVMPVRAGDPDVAAIVMDPGAGVADGPVVRCSVRICAKNRIPAGNGISCDQAPDPVWRAREGL
jgi:hypothetical protein